MTWFGFDMHMDIGTGLARCFLFLFSLLSLMFSKIIFENGLNPYIGTPINGVPHHYEPKISTKIEV